MRQNNTFDYTNYLDQLVPLLQTVQQMTAEGQLITTAQLNKLLRKFPKDHSQTFARDELVTAYRHLAGQHGLPDFREDLVRQLQMKPTRTQSGVTPVTVLTKPFPCPGKCIFCPNDIRMPKSYLADEPGAQRAERNYFDPYLQTYTRLQAFQNIGHAVNKVELIILGGTWSYYPESYQIWFIKECFRALNNFSIEVDDRQRIENRYAEVETKLEKLKNETSQLRSEPQAPTLTNDPLINKQETLAYQIHGTHIDKSYNQTVSELYVGPEKLSGVDQYQQSSWNDLIAEQKINETTRCRNVGLVIETRPDNISEAEVLRIRKLGCTKTQIGIQSLSDEVLDKNKRGHDVAATRHAFKLLRQAGFKIHAHWMPNLYGSFPEQDKQDYDLLFADKDFKPDELKIYPCSLIESAELMQYYQDGRWRPYSEAELLDVLTYVLSHTPEYCRLTRVIRDIPSTDIVVGNKKTNFRQIAEKNLSETDQQSHDIRAREIKLMKVARTDLNLDDLSYQTLVSTEHFLQFITSKERKIAGFLRLSFPTQTNFITELKDAAIIREVHVYGQVMGLGKKEVGRAQHLGLGTELLEEAKRLAFQAGFKKIAVISAVGTREYYRDRGFEDGELYQFSSTFSSNSTAKKA